MVIDILASWGYAAAKALSEGSYKWTIRTVYIEFENVADPGNPASIPTIDPLDPSAGLPYFDALSSSSSRDYLRVPLISTPLLGIATGYSGYFIAPAGNKLSIFAQTNGTVGVHGKAFANASNSKVCGAALVVSPVDGDPTQDIVIGRGYLASSDQILKLDGEQLGIRCDLTFPLPA